VLEFGKNYKVNEECRSNDSVDKTASEAFGFLRRRDDTVQMLALHILKDNFKFKKNRLLGAFFVLPCTLQSLPYLI